MEKKTVFLELPCELIEQIDKINNTGDRSSFITTLLEKQVRKATTKETDTTQSLKTTMHTDQTTGFSAEIGVTDNNGTLLGNFDLNTVEGFEKLAKKIEEVSEDPVVRIRARRWL